jgi:hypothetical protein
MRDDAMAVSLRHYPENTNLRLSACTQAMSGGSQKNQGVPRKDPSPERPELFEARNQDHFFSFSDMAGGQAGMNTTRPDERQSTT